MKAIPPVLAVALWALAVWTWAAGGDRFGVLCDAVAGSAWALTAAEQWRQRRLERRRLLHEEAKLRELLRRWEDELR